MEGRPFSQRIQRQNPYLLVVETTDRNDAVEEILCECIDACDFPQATVEHLGIWWILAMPTEQSLEIFNFPLPPDYCKHSSINNLLRFFFSEWKQRTYTSSLEASLSPLCQDSRAARSYSGDVSVSNDSTVSIRIPHLRIIHSYSHIHIFTWPGCLQYGVTFTSCTVCWSKKLTIFSNWISLTQLPGSPALYINHLNEAVDSYRERTLGAVLLNESWLQP